MPTEVAELYEAMATAAMVVNDRRQAVRNATRDLYRGMDAVRHGTKADYTSEKACLAAVRLDCTAADKVFADRAAAYVAATKSNDDKEK